MITKQHGKMKSTTTQIQTQTLIKTFRGNTHCLITEKYAGNLDDLETKIKDFIFKKEGIPQSLQRLALDITQEPYICRLSLNGGLRGGKGGFATLLKGQSKQAGAKMTTSYGACRDLSGRRLRHVNDEIRLRKWREAKRRREAGLPVDEVADSRTRSGISGWHLAVPGWSDVQISDKQVKASERRLRREIDWKSREEKQRIAQKEAKKMAQEQTVLSYATVGRHIGEDNDDNVAFGFQMDKAIAMGMKKANAGAAKSNNRKRSSPEKETKASLAAASEHSMSWLGSLSGEVVEGREEDVIQELHRKSDDATKQVDNLTIVQSKSEFATGCILTPNNLCQGRWYYEVILQTAGVAQIGWANDQFTADSSNGDGVGDDGNSWGYDGFRQLKFHNSVISEYGDEWKSGDCIGCLYDGDKGMLSYYVNGKEIGDAFTLKSNNSDKKGGVTNALYPAFSLNEEEILSVRVGPFFEYMPKECRGVNEIMGEVLESEQHRETDQKVPSTKVEEEVSSNTYVPPSINKPSLFPVQTIKRKIKSAAYVKKVTKPETLDLDQYDSVEDLEKLGLERLKSALMAIGVKCGGALNERAKRLFSLKGLRREEYPVKVRAKGFAL